MVLILCSAKVLFTFWCVTVLLEGHKYIGEIRQPFGIRMCSSLCRNFGNCRLSKFDTDHLACITGDDSVPSEGLHYLGEGEIHTTKTWYRKLVTRKKTIVLIQEKLRTYEDAAGIQDGYIRLSDGKTHMYVKRHGYDKTWDEALHVCQTEGANLVKIDSRKKHRLLAKELYNSTKEYLWIGLRDNYDNDTWVWTDGTRADDFKRWGINEPSNVYKGKQENCAAMISYPYFGAKWFDLACEKRCNFVCEKPILENTNYKP